MMRQGKNKLPVLLVGSSVQHPDLEYITGFHVADPIVFLGFSGHKQVIVPELEYGRASRAIQEATIWTPRMLGLKPPARNRLANWALALLKKNNIRKVLVSGAFPLSVARRLDRAGITMKIAVGALFESRAVKTAEEIKNIRESQQAAVIAMRSAIAAISRTEIDRHGFLAFRGKKLTAEHIQQLIARVLFEQNCQGRDTVVACGDQAVDPHEKGSGPLRAHEAIVMDIFPQNLKHGYWGDLTRTVVRGEPSSMLNRMYQGVKMAQIAALNHIRPGIKCSQVHKRAAQKLQKYGFSTQIINGQMEGFIHSTGHGVGLAIHEAPSLSPSGEECLRKGHVVTVEPGLYYRGLGGIRIEDTVVVTATGWRYLAPCEKRFKL